VTAVFSVRTESMKCRISKGKKKYQHRVGLVQMGESPSYGLRIPITVGLDPSPGNGGCNHEREFIRHWKRATNSGE